MTTRSVLCVLWPILTCSAQAELLELDDVASAERLVVRAWQATVELRESKDGGLTVDYECTSANSPDSDDLREVGGGRERPDLRRFDGIIMLVATDVTGYCQLRIVAPATLDVELQVTDKGSISVYGWPSSLAAWLAVGDLKVVQQMGPFSVTAMSGEASVELAVQALSSDSGITAANGNVVLTVLGRPAVTIRAQAPQGRIKSNLEEDFAIETHNGQDWSTARLSGGGAIITLRNLNSDIAILGSDDRP